MDSAKTEPKKKKKFGEGEFTLPPILKPLLEDRPKAKKKAAGKNP